MMKSASRSPGRRLRFTLRSLLVAAVVCGLVCGFGLQQFRIHRLSQELSESQTATPIMLFHVPAGRSHQKIAGYIGGQFMECSAPIKISDRKNGLEVAAEEDGLVVNVNGQVVRCKTFWFDSTSGRLAADEAQFFERLGIDYDFSAN
jgi:hypothetical protein